MDRLKRMGTYTIVIFFIVYLLFTFLVPVLDIMTDLWKPLYQRTGIDEEFGIDPTGIVDRLAAFIMTIVVAMAITYFATTEIGEKIVGWIWRKIPLLKNFAPRQTNETISKEMQEVVTVTEEELKSMTPVLIPHYGYPGHCANCTCPDRDLPFNLYVGYDFGFVTVTQPTKFTFNGKTFQMVFLSGFKPSFPIVFQGTPVVLTPKPDLIVVQADDFNEIRQWFGSGAWKKINPYLNLKPAEGITLQFIDESGILPQTDQ